MVEVPDHRDALGIGSPNGKVGPLHSAVLHHMRAELLVDLVMRAFVEEIDIHLAEHRPEAIRILLPPRFPEVAFHLQLIVERSLNAAQGGFKKTIRMDLVQGKATIRRRWYQRSRLPRHPGEERARTGFLETREFRGA